MSRFYASIHGNRGEGTRQGSERSGIHGHVRGWNIGARVRCFVGTDGTDRVSVSITGGSNGSGKERYLGTFARTKGGRMVRLDGPERGRKVRKVEAVAEGV